MGRYLFLPVMGHPWATFPSELHLPLLGALSFKRASPVVFPVMSSSTCLLHFSPHFSKHISLSVSSQLFYTFSTYSFCSLFLFISGLWIIWGKDFPFPYNFTAEIIGRGGLKFELAHTLPTYKKTNLAIASSYPNCKDFWIKSLISMIACVCNSAVNISLSSGFWVSGFNLAASN